LPGDLNNIILTTDRLKFRQLRESDLETLAQINDDPAVMKFIGKGGTKSPEQTRDELRWILKLYESRGYGLWGTILRENDQLIGRCGLIPWTIEEIPELEVAYLLAREYWGQGLATEAATGIINYAFKEYSWDHLISLIYPDNTASIRVAEKAGMHRHKQVNLFDSSVLMYRILRKDWESESNKDK